MDAFRSQAQEARKDAGLTDAALCGVVPVPASSGKTNRLSDNAPDL